MKTKLRALLSVKVILALLMAAVVLVAAATFFYFTINVPVSVEASKIEFWDTGCDSLNISRTISTDKSWVQMSIVVTPNATVAYPDAIRFNATEAGDFSLQIAYIVDGSSIIKGIKCYVFQNASGNDDFQLIGGIGSSHGPWLNLTNVGSSPSPKCSVGYQSDSGWANDEYGDTSTTTALWSSEFSISSTEIEGGASQAYWKIVIETYGVAEASETATVYLKAVWTPTS